MYPEASTKTLLPSEKVMFLGQDDECISMEFVHCGEKHTFICCFSIYVGIYGDPWGRVGKESWA